jgi:hypothetical protein
MTQSQIQQLINAVQTLDALEKADEILTDALQEIEQGNLEQAKMEEIRNSLQTK